VDALRDEIANCDAFVRILTERSLSSEFVLMELGAAWAYRKAAFLVLDPSVSFGNIPGRDNEERERTHFTDLILSPPQWTDTYYGRSKNQEALDQIVDAPYLQTQETFPFFKLPTLLHTFSGDTPNLRMATRNDTAASAQRLSRGPRKQWHRESPAGQFIPKKLGANVRLCSLTMPRRACADRRQGGEREGYPLRVLRLVTPRPTASPSPLSLALSSQHGRARRLRVGRATPPRARTSADTQLPGPSAQGPGLVLSRYRARQRSNQPSRGEPPGFQTLGSSSSSRFFGQPDCSF
jgi:hypothetical protein